MSIRIINNKTGRTIIVKNQDDMNNLDDTLSTMNTSDRGFDLFADNDDTNPYNNYGTDSFEIPDINSNSANRRKYFNDRISDDWLDYDSFDADVDRHYRDVSAYPLSKEIQSWHDPTTVDTPILKLKDVDIPDSQTFPLDSDEQNDEFGLSMDDTGMNQDENLDDNFFDDNVPEEAVNDDENSDFQGMIRTVHGACLVYKRSDGNGTYDELWVYNVGSDLRTETAIRKSIIAGTDIDPNKQMSDDGKQKAKTYTIGNVQFLHITGMVQ